MVPGSNNLRTKWNLKITPFYCKSMPVEEKRRFTDEAKAVKYSLQTGQSIREEIIPMGCLYFCEVADFCPQFQKLKKIFKSSNI